MECLGSLAENCAPSSTYFAARQRLLTPPWNDRILSLREVRNAGMDLAGNPNDLSIFGLKPLAWYALGIRILGRTAVELTRDAHAKFMATSVARSLSKLSVAIEDVFDPFAGSGNMLFHMAKETKARHAIGLDAHAHISELTRRNFRRLRFGMRLRGTEVSIVGHDWTAAKTLLRDRPTLFVISPPWGEAFTSAGLDLRKTTPAVMTILDYLAEGIRVTPAFVAIQTYPKMVLPSVTEILDRYQSYQTETSNDPYVKGSLDYLLLKLPSQSAT